MIMLTQKRVGYQYGIGIMIYIITELGICCFPGTGPSGKFMLYGL